MCFCLEIAGDAIDGGAFFMGHDDSRWSWGQGTGLWKPSGNMAIGEIPERNGGLLGKAGKIINQS
jgi:hypothetical protein